MGRNQMMTKRMKAAIEERFMDALRFAPMEDLVQLGLDTVSMPCIDSKDDSAALLSDAENMIAALHGQVTDLQAKLNKKAGKKSS